MLIQSICKSASQKTNALFRIRSTRTVRKPGFRVSGYGTVFTCNPICVVSHWKLKIGAALHFGNPPPWSSATEKGIDSPDSFQNSVWGRSLRNGVSSIWYSSNIYQTFLQISLNCLKMLNVHSIFKSH